MNNTIMRPLFDSESSTWSYLLIDKNTADAVIIDPVLEQLERDVTLLRELEVNLKYIFETHIHADHITAASALKDETRALITYGAANEVNGADRYLEDGDEVKFGESFLRTIPTPGHTSGCTSYYGGDTVFTGDTLLIRGCGRTDFQSGSAPKLFESVRTRLFTLPPTTRVCPAHDYKGRVFSTIGEEMKHNPRLKLENGKEEFERIMDSLNLAYPKKIDIAVPANLNAGRIEPVMDYVDEKKAAVKTPSVK